MNGQWDARLEAVGSSMIHIACALVFLRVFGARYEWWRRILLVAFLGVLFSLPYNTANTLRGFQSQFYFLVLFNCLYLYGSIRFKAPSWAWAGSQMIGVAALFSMGSGFLGGVAILLVMAFKIFIGRQWQNSDLLRIISACLIIGWGISLMYHPAASAHYQVTSVREFFISLMTLLSWPSWGIWAWSVQLLPMLVFFFWGCLRREHSESYLLVLGILLFCGIQIAALSYGRGHVSQGYADRYTDLLALVLLGTFLSWNYIHQHAKKSPWLLGGFLVFGVFWGVLMGPALWQRSFSRNPVHESGRQLRADQQRILSTFIETDDPSVFNNHSFEQNTYPSTERLVMILRNPTIRSILPVSIRPTIAAKPATEMAQGFERDAVSPAAKPRGFNIWGSYQASESEDEAFWRSTTIDSSLPMVRMKVAGYYGHGKNELRFIGVEDPGSIRYPMLDSSPGNQFKTVSSFVPDGSYVLEAVDINPSGWMAFSDVREMGLFSWLCKNMVNGAVGILVTGLILLALASMLMVAAGLKCKKPER